MFTDVLTRCIFLTQRLSAWPTNLSKAFALNSVSDSTKLQRKRSTCFAGLLETSLLVALQLSNGMRASNPAGSRSKMMSSQDGQQQQDQREGRESSRVYP